MGGTVHGLMDSTLNSGSSDMSLSPGGGFIVLCYWARDLIATSLHPVV